MSEAATPPTTNTTLTEGITSLIHERNTLRSELALTKSAIQELLSQLNHLHLLLDQSRAELDSLASTYQPSASTNPPHTPRPASPDNAFHSALNFAETHKMRSSVRILPDSYWLHGDWLSTPLTREMLGNAEAAYKEGKPQAALNALDALKKVQRLPHPMRIESLLLASTIFRTASDSENLQRALDLAQQALKLATRYNLFELIGKAQFQRGLCFMQQQRYADARWSFSLASWTAGYEGVVWEWGMKAEDKMFEVRTTGEGGEKGMVVCPQFEWDGSVG
ncbi:MAG: hypothetical protein M1834_005296 [Cirrosporium novae-zelandiae]|nr:MAG: hypothetical protein M1834_005296 [Cirrosporium novae-zelandiae]